MLFALIILTMVSQVSVQAEDSIIVGGQVMPLGPIALTKPASTISAPTAPFPPLASGLSNSQTVFPDAPSLSGTYSVRGKTLRPYVGPGFSNDYATDLDRSLRLRHFTGAINDVCAIQTSSGHIVLYTASLGAFAHTQLWS